MTEKISPFYTELVDPNAVQQRSKELRHYIDNMEDKLEYVNWKQDLILAHNYEPLASIIKKTEEAKQEHLRKIDVETKRNQRIYNTDKIAMDLNNYREFSEKLTLKLKEYQTELNQIEIKRDLLAAELNYKKDSLKEVIDENLKINGEVLKSQGIYNKKDIEIAVRQRTITLKTPLSSRKTPVKQSQLPVKIINEFSRSRFLYEDSLELIIKSIKNMNSIEDVQQGIFLEIMPRAKSKSSVSLKSKIMAKSSLIYNILLDNYEQHMKKKNEPILSIEWETFKKFNWRQILGVLLIKDPDCESLRSLSKLMK